MKIRSEKNQHTTMTDDELKASSPWLDYLNNLRSNYNGEIDSHLFYDNINVIHPDDYAIIETYNNARKKEEHRFITNLLAAPFQGNPLTAKVVFLSLNPGYVEHSNRDLAKVFERITDLPQKINALWSSFLSHEATAMSPSQQDKDLFTAYQTLVDWYWYNAFAKLRESCHLSDDVFFQKVAIVQLMPYHSIKCEKVIFDLPTMQYTKKLIHHLLKRPDCPLFVVMRSEKMWAKLLGSDSNEVFDFNKDKKHFILRKRDINEHLPRGQYINENAFLDEGCQKIINAIIKS